MDQLATRPSQNAANASPKIDRRAFLRGVGKSLGKTLSNTTLAAGSVAAATVAVGSLLPTTHAVAHSVAIPPVLKRSIKLYNTHTRESLDIVYRIDSEYVEDSLTKLYVLLRDHRQNEVMVIDEALFDRLWTVQQILGEDSTYDIISGYRSPKTNAMLRERSSRVAVNSYHMKGRAIDIRPRNIPLDVFRKAALSLNAGGVGYYPGSQFVHLDTGPVRNWVS